MSTPCRLAFDASQPTSSGASLNDLLKKGKNNMNKLTIWTSHFEMLKEIENFKFHRAIIPVDVVNLNVYTIDTADEGNQIACAAI